MQAHQAGRGGRETLEKFPSVHFLAFPFQPLFRFIFPELGAFENG